MANTRPDRPRKRALLDVDGVVAKMIEELARRLTKFGATRPDGTPYSVEHFTEWSLQNILGHHYPLAEAIMSMEDFWSGMAVYPEAAASLQKVGRNFDVVFVSSPWEGCRTWAAARSEWLFRNVYQADLLPVPSHRKELVDGHFLVEDRPSTLQAWLEYHPLGTGYLVRRPWNRSSAITGPAARRVVIVNGLDEALAMEKP